MTEVDIGLHKGPPPYIYIFSFGPYVQNAIVMPCSQDNYLGKLCFVTVYERLTIKSTFIGDVLHSVNLSVIDIMI